jgi:hypothetical protein
MAEHLGDGDQIGASADEGGREGVPTNVGVDRYAGKLPRVCCGWLVVCG